MEGGRRFCLYHTAAGTVRGALVHVHAFGEEMNFSRRMVALQAQALANAGYAVLQVDLYGCGDSEGGFAEADWATWVADVVAASGWLKARTGLPVGLWGVRSGCLLVAEAVAQLAAVPPYLLLWQPVLSGADYWRHLRRLKLMGEVLGESAADRGEAIEIAGYPISPALAAGMQAARIDLAPANGRLACVVVGNPAAGLGLPLTQAMARWRDGSWRIEACTIAGEAFWLQAEAADNAALVTMTLDVLRKLDDGH